MDTCAPYFFFFLSACLSLGLLDFCLFLSSLNRSSTSLSEPTNFRRTARSHRRTHLAAVGDGHVW
jgi:hypothetical protein